MSIASRINPTRADHQRISGDYLWEPESAEMEVAFIAGEQIGPGPREPLAAFAEILLNLQRGIEGDEINKTIKTIDLLIELAYLHTRDHRGGLEQFRAKLEGRIKPDGSIDNRIGAEAATRVATGEAPASNEGDPREQATEHFIELLDEHGSEPRIRARLVEVLESRTGEDVLTEAIQIVRGEAYQFTNGEGAPVIWIVFDVEGTPTVEFNRYADCGAATPEGANTSSEATGQESASLKPAAQAARDGGGVDGQVIEATDGETYLFTDRRGLPALVVSMDAEYIIAEAKDTNGNIVNGMVFGYNEGRAPVGDQSRRNRWKLIGELQELIDHEPLFGHVEKVIWAAQRTKTEGEGEFERQILADAVALLLESPHTPNGLRRSVADELLSISSDTKASDPLEPENVREWLPIALGRLESGDQGRRDQAPTPQRNKGGGKSAKTRGRQTSAKGGKR